MAKEENKDYELIIRKLAFLEDRVKKLEAELGSQGKRLREQESRFVKYKRSVKNNKL